MEGRGMLPCMEFILVKVVMSLCLGGNETVEGTGRADYEGIDDERDYVECAVGCITITA